MTIPEKTYQDLDTRAISVAKFCRMYGIAHRTFYNNRKYMPETFKLGRRTLIFMSVVEIWEEKVIKNCRGPKTQCQHDNR